MRDECPPDPLRARATRRPPGDPARSRRDVHAEPRQTGTVTDIEPARDVVVRDATVGDLPALPAVEAAADARYATSGHPELADGSTIPEEVAARAVERAQLAVATVDDVVVGWVYWGRVGDELSIGQICVTPEYGRRGVGSALLQCVLARATAAGEPTVVLNTQSDVQWNRPWYERHGFFVVDELAWTDGMRAVTAAQSGDGLDWSSRVHMRLQLHGPLR